MSLKIKVNKNGKEYYADSDKVFTWLMERYLSNEVRKTQAKLEPYKVRLDNFFESLKTTELEWYEELQKAYPAIDLDFALKRAKLWLSSNYKKDFKKFLMNWMSKENPTIQIEQKRIDEPRKPKPYVPPAIDEKDVAEPEEISSILKSYMKDKPNE